MFIANVFIFTFFAISLYKFIDPNNISEPVFIALIMMALSFAIKRMIDAFLRVDGKFKV